MSRSPHLETASSSSLTAAEQPKARRGRDLVSVNIGNTLEWFDWNIYAIFAPFFAAQFFISSDPVSNLLSVLAIFAVGFLVRPIGGWVFGRLADRRGRRFSLALAIVLAAVGSLVIAIAPTAEQAGLLAPAVLLAARMLQGLSHGGETGSAFTYLAESAPRVRRGLWASTPWVGVGVGTLLASGLGVFLTSTLTSEQMSSFGWRIPFIIGALIGTYAIVIRLRMNESEIFEANHKANSDSPRQPLAAAVGEIWQERRKVLTIAGLTISCVVVFYTWFIFAPTYAITKYGMPPQDALMASLFGQAVFVAAVLPFGWLSDRIGRRPVMLMFSIGFVLVAFPLEWMLGPSPLSLFATMAIASILMAACCAPVGAVFAELVPTKIRATVIGLTYASTAAIFGGTAPYLNTWLSSIGSRGWFVAYMILLCAVTTVVVLRMPETKERQLD